MTKGMFALLLAGALMVPHVTPALGTDGAASDVVGIWRGAISGHLKVSFQAARSIG
jgi:hypothetical protein